MGKSHEFGVHARVTCGRNHKIIQSVKQRHSHLHKISVLILCNLVVYMRISTQYSSKYNLVTTDFPDVRKDCIDRAPLFRIRASIDTTSHERSRRYPGPHAHASGSNPGRRPQSPQRPRSPRAPQTRPAQRLLQPSSSRPHPAT